MPLDAAGADRAADQPGSAGAAAIAQLLALAAAGDGLARVRLANRLFEGRATPCDPLQAERLLRAAAEAGDGLAQLGLGQRLLYGMGLAEDPHTGEAWLARAAEAGFPPAQEAWGRHLQDTRRPGAYWLRLSAEAGFAPGATAWAEFLLDRGDDAEGERWLAAGMAGNHGRAFALAGRRQLAVDPTEGEGLLAEALRRRDIPAGLELGLLRYQRQDFAGAAAAWASCLKLGAGAAAINLAAMVRRGEWPADRPRPDIAGLLAAPAADGNAFAIINLALWTAQDSGAVSACRAAVYGLPPGAERDAARAWWAGLAAAGDPEGFTVLSWLDQAPG